MRAIGVIAEYNPFHLGHERHIQWIKTQYPNTPLIIAMSGAMTQRGELASFDKWTRALAALQAGADIVVALPTAYSLSSAEHFGRAGVQLLNHLHIDALSFGVEAENKEALLHIASLLDSPSVHAYIKGELKEGAPYSTAVRKALASAAPEYAELIASPNNSLALTYIRAIQELPQHIDILPLKRNSDHHSEEEQVFPSGSYLRKRIDMGLPFDSFLATTSKDLLLNAYKQGHVVDIERYRDFLLLTGRLTSADTLSTTAGFVEGIEQRWKKAFAAATYKEALESVKTKRFTYASLQRMTAAMALHMEKETHESLLATGPLYAQLLATSPLGRSYIKEQEFSIPVITKWAPFYKQATTLQKASLDLDQKAQDIQQFCFKVPSEGNQDFKKHPHAHT